MIDATSLYNRVIDQGGRIELPIERVSSTQLDIKDVDYTSFLRVGMAIEVTDSAGVKYGYISALSVVSGDTRITALWVNGSNAVSSLAVGDLSGLYISQNRLRSHPGSISITPTWNNVSIGNGTTSVKIAVISNMVMGKAVLTFGSTTSISGDITLDIPLGTIDNVEGSVIGNVRSWDNGNTNHPGICLFTAGTILPRAEVVSGSNVVSTNITSTVPFTWGNTDVLFINFTYEII